MGLTISRLITGNEANQPPGLSDLGECSICLDSLNNTGEFNARNVTITPCEHLYHRECLDTNMAHDRRCPNCRFRINPERIVALPLNLHEAAERGSMPAVKRLIDKFPVDALNGQGETALMLAARNGNLEIVKTLINHGANPATCTRDNLTAFDMAQSDNMRYHLIKVLIEQSIAPDIPCDNAGRHITHYLTELNGSGLRHFLQCTDIDVNTLTATLHSAFQKGKADIAEVLIDCGANINLPSDQEGSTWLYHALKSKNWNVTKKLVAAGANFLMPASIDENETIWAVTKLVATAANFLMPASIDEKVTIADWAVKHLELNEIHSLIDEEIINVDQLTQDNISTLYHRVAEQPRSLYIFVILAEKGVDLNLKSDWAVKHLKLSEIYWLIDEGIINVDQLTQDNISTLCHRAAEQSKSLFIFEILAEKGADLNLKSDWAAKHLTLHEFCSLINKGIIKADQLTQDNITTLCDNAGRHIIHFLTELNCSDLRTVLKYTDIDGNTLTAILHVALQTGKADIAKVLIDCGANINSPFDQEGSTLLYHALKSKNWVATEILMAAGANFLFPANINGKGTVSDWAVQHLELSRIYSLIDEGIIKVDQLTQDNISTLCHREARESQGTPILEVLAKKGVDLNLKSDWAIRHFELHQFCNLIHKGIIKVDQLTQDNITTLCHRAARQSHKTFVFDILAKNGVDLNLKDKNGETALHVAAREADDLQPIRKLIELGVKVDATNSGGETALHVMATRQSSFATTELVRAGANVDARAHDGSTPLHRAAQNGCSMNAYELIASGARQKILNHNGKTALQLAAENNKAETVYTFLSLGGDYATCTENGDMLFDLFPPDDLLSAFGRTSVLDILTDFNPGCLCSRDGSTLLSYAIRSENTVAINKLLNWDASTNNLTPEQRETLKRVSHNATYSSEYSSRD